MYQPSNSEKSVSNIQARNISLFFLLNIVVMANHLTLTLFNSAQRQF